MSACSYQIDGLILDLLEPRHLSCAGATAAAAAGGRDDDDDECAGGTVMRRGGNATRGRLLYSGRFSLPAYRSSRLVCYDTYVSVLVLRIIDGRDPMDIDHVRCTRNTNTRILQKLVESGSKGLFLI